MEEWERRDRVTGWGTCGLVCFQGRGEMLTNCVALVEMDGADILKYLKAGKPGQWHPTPVLLPGESRGRRSLVRCSPWDCKESDTTERLNFHFSLPCIGEGNGNPLQHSCLENPMDRGAWWAAVCGVAQSRTRLKWLSSSSSCCC